MTKLAPDGLVAAFLLALLATAGLFYVNILAALVTGLAEGLGISPARAGQIGSANVYGAAFGALVAVFLVKRIAWRPAAALALIVLLALDLASTLTVDDQVLLLLRALHGLAGGLLVGVGFSVIARTVNPDRVYGMLLVVQFGFGGLGLWLLPPLVPQHGTWVLFAALMAFSAVTLALLPLVPHYPRAVSVAGEALPVARRPLAAALVGIFLFQAGNMGLAAYVIELGRSAGLTQSFIGPTLAVANWLGACGSILVIFLGKRFGRTRPILYGIALTLAGTAAFHWSGVELMFVAANIATAILWAFVIPYLLALASAFDGVGQSAALGGFLSKLGLATGPLLASHLLGQGGFDLIINASLALLLASGLAAAWPAIMIDRADNPDLKA